MVKSRSRIGSALRAAINAAANSTHLFRVGCTVIRNGKIVSTGYNKIKTHPELRIKYEHYSIHGECDALLRADKSGDTIVVARIMKDGSLGQSKPCPKCMKFITDCGVHTVYFTNDLGDLERMAL